MDDNGVITVRDLRRRYGGPGGRGFEAVRGVTFSVRRGELFALLGTNGAGKTSAMEVLEGLAPAARGAVRVLGCDPCRERALVRRRMGIMLQEGGFPPDLTVAETGRMWAGTLSERRPVAEALGLVSLGHRAGVAVRSLSGGERRLICSTGVSWQGCGSRVTSCPRTEVPRTGTQAQILVIPSTTSSTWLAILWRLLNIR